MRLVFTKPRFPMFCQELRQAGLRVNDDLTRSQQAERSSLNLDFHGVKSTSWEEKSRQNLSSCMIWWLSQMSHICMCAVDLLQSFTCLKFNTNWCITTSIRGEFYVTDKGTRPNRYGNKITNKNVFRRCCFCRWKIKVFFGVSELCNALSLTLKGSED